MSKDADLQADPKELRDQGAQLVLGDRFDPVRVFEFVRAQQGQYPIALMCRVLGVSTSGYYAWLQRSPSRRARENEALSRRITKIHADSRQTYGARRVHAALEAKGVKASRPRVERLMRALGLRGRVGSHTRA